MELGVVGEAVMELGVVDNAIVEETVVVVSVVVLDVMGMGELWYCES